MRQSEYNELWKCFDATLPGVFSHLASMDVPWADTLTGAALDDVYMNTWSGSKPPSPFVRRLAETNDGPLTTTQVERVAQMVYNMNSADWLRSWDAEAEEYDPISNYDMREVMEDDIHEREETGTGSTTYGRTDTRTDNLSDGHGHTITRTDDLETTRTGTDTTATSGESTTLDETQNKTYGLNSATAVPADESTSSNETQTEASETVTHNTVDARTGTETTAHSGTDTHTGTQTHAEGGTDTTSDSKTSTDTHSYTLTRTGNIGVTTAQDMLTQERVLRAWRLFYDRVFPDVDRVLTLCTY